MARVVLTVVLLVFGLALPAAAQETASLLPAIPKATGKPHPEGNAWWRQNHMKLLKHDRNLTMREGDRNIQASLKGCFECHSVKDEAGQYVTVKDERHFCRVCHDYAAVKIDCFMCHRSTPDGVDEAALVGREQAALAPIDDAAAEEMVAYLESLGETVADGTGASQ